MSPKRQHENFAIPLSRHSAGKLDRAPLRIWRYCQLRPPLVSALRKGGLFRLFAKIIHRLAGVFASSMAGAFFHRLSPRPYSISSRVG
jgi:hypothetical protein